MNSTEKFKGKAMYEIPILVVSHCILNRSTRWWQREKPIAKNRGMTIRILSIVARLRMGIIQLPCPEFTFCGNPRPPRTKDEYLELPGFREHCRKLAEEAAEELMNLIKNAKEPRIKILAVIGVERSPTCGVKCTPVGKGSFKRYVEEEGIFIRMLNESLKKREIYVPFMGVDLDEPEKIAKKISRLL